MAKRGRPKKPPRDAIDYGTPELQRHRMFISPKDTTQSTCPVDALLARKLISPDAHSAAVHFRACRAMMFGSPHPKAVDLTQTSGHDFSGETGEVEQKYRDACARLKQFSRSHFDAIENIVIHERWPAWLMRKGGRGDNHARAKALEGFGVLLAWTRTRSA